MGEVPDCVVGATMVLKAAGGATLPEEGCKLDEVMAMVERQLILQALERSGGVKTKACGLLGVTFRSLRYRMGKLNMEVGEREEDMEGNGPESSGGV